jgi:large conductance mechanosensitive channel
MATKRSASSTKKETSAAAAKAAKAAAQEAETSAHDAERSATSAKTFEKKAENLVGKLGVHKQINGFVDFLREQSVVGLAIGLVLGTQAKVLVDQMIASFINPLVGLLLPGQGALNEKIFTLHINGKTAAFGWGAFVSSLLTFVVVAAVVYFVFKGLRLDKLDKKKVS